MSVLVKWMHVNWVRLFAFHVGPILNFASTATVLTSSLSTPLVTFGPPSSVFQLPWLLFVKGSKLCISFS